MAGKRLKYFVIRRDVKPGNKVLKAISSDIGIHDAGITQSSQEDAPEEYPMLASL